EAPFSVSAENVTERLMGEMVSGNYFRTLGVAIVAGRDFLPEEDEVVGRNPVAIISERLWQRYWNRDAGVLGKQVIVNGHRFTIVGVAGEGFRSCQNLYERSLWHNRGHPHRGVRQRGRSFPGQGPCAEA